MMNNDLISREALREPLEKTFHQLNSTVEKVLLGGVLAVVDMAPAVDAEPVRHGKWGEPVIVGYDGVNVIWARPCSACGYENRYYGTHYCPNCGAKMDGDAE